MSQEQQGAKLLGALQALSLRTDRTEQGILDAAMKREAHVAEHLERLRPRVVFDSQASLQYQKALLERRRLQVVIAMARKNLGAARS